MRQICLILAALIAGYGGGILAISHRSPERTSSPPDVIRARTFELVNEKGQVISFWGTDSQDTIVLAFASPTDLPQISGTPRRMISDGGIRNPRNQFVSIGVLSGQMPALYMRGPEGQTRVRLYLTPYGQPELLMDDEKSNRIALGVGLSDTPGPQDRNWNLTFQPLGAAIGTTTEDFNGSVYVRGFLYVNKERTVYSEGQSKVSGGPVR